MSKTIALRWMAVAVASSLAFALVEESSALAASVAFSAKGFNATGGGASPNMASKLGPGGTERYMLVHVVFDTAYVNSIVTSITHVGSSNLTKLSAASGTNGCHMETWGVVNPSTNSTNGNLVINVSPDSTFFASYSAWTGVDQVRPLRDIPTIATGTASPASVTAYPTTGDALVDVGCLASAPALTLGGGQTILGDGTNANTKGMNSYKLIASTASTTMSRTFSGTVTWQLTAIDLKGSTATGVRLESFGAAVHEAEVRIGWRTGFEVDNLGFHIYRDDGRGRVRLTAAPIVGSALLAGSGISLRAGQIYSWDDPIAADRQGSSRDWRYWLEEIDLNGQRTLYGPTAVTVPLSDSQPSDVPTSHAALLKKVTAPAPYDAVPAPSIAPPAVLGFGQENARQWARAASSAIKLGVDHEGWYQVRRADLVAAGLDASADPRRLSLYLEGREIPILVRGEEDGQLDEGDSVGFFGRGVDSPSTDTRVYWLAVGERPGLRIEHAAPSLPTGAAPQSFVTTVEGRPRSVYFAALMNGDESNFFGPIINATPVTLPMRVHHRVPGGRREAVLEVGVQGVSSGVHDVAVSLGGQSLGVLTSNERDRRSARFSVAEDLLPESDVVEVSLQAQGGDADVSLVDFVRLEYPRAFVADGEGDQAALRMVVPGGNAVTVTGFPPGQEVDVVDVTEPLQPVLLPGAAADASGQRTIVTSGAGPRVLLAFCRGHSEPLRWLVANGPSHWTAVQPGSDLVVIGPASLLPGIQPLERLRKAQGWRVALVDIEDVYDELSFGTKHPAAIRSFVHRATQAWKSPPRAILLLGDATLDPRDFLGKGAFDLVPTKLVDTALLETSSDDWMTDFDGDGVADVPVGRIPARTPVDVATMVAKLVAAPRFATVAGASAGGPLVFALDNSDELFDFRTAARAVQLAVPADYRTVVIDRLDGGNPFERLQQALRLEPFYVSYFGHGSAGMWAGGMLSNESVALLEDRGPGAFWAQSTCLTGFFQDSTQPSLAETLLAKASGGAFGIWASSGLTDLPDQTDMQRAFTRNLLAGGMAVGEAARRAKVLSNSMDVRRTWILFGDPTWRLVDPPPSPSIPDAGSPDSSDMAPSRPPSTAGCGCILAEDGGGGSGTTSLALLLGLMVLSRRRGRHP